MGEQISRNAKLYIASLSVAAVIISVYALINTDWYAFQSQWLPFLVFLTIIILADSFPVPLPRGGSVTVSFAAIAASILIFQPFIVIVMAIARDIFLLIKRENTIKHVFNIAQFAVSTGSAAIVFNYFYAPVEADFNYYQVTAFIASMVVLFILNHTFVTLILAFTQDEKPYTIWLTNIKWCTLQFLSMAPLGALIAVIYINIGFWGLVLFLLPMIIARHSFQSYIDMRQTFLDTIKSLSLAIDAKDPYTKGHSSRVSDYAVMLAREMKWPEDRIEFLKYVALIHDVGKVAVPESILKKDRLLTTEEYDIMKKHSEAGAEVIKDVSFFAAGSGIIKHHHESWDGNGYPERLKGEEIPEGARILSVADAYDAMTSDRPYRKALKPMEAFKEIQDCSGTQFDPKVVKAFSRIIPQLSLKTDRANHPEYYTSEALHNT